MIHWVFKCLKCNYGFKAIEPKELYNAYTSCAMCGSIEFEKKVTRNEKKEGRET